MRTVTKRLIGAEAATAQEHGVGFLDDVSGFVGDDDPTSNLVGSVDEGSDGDVVFAHGCSLSVFASNIAYKAPFLVRKLNAQ